MRFSSFMKFLRIITQAVALIVIIYGIGRFVEVAIDSRLSGTIPVYLQQASATAMTLRWHSDEAYAAEVLYGTSLDQLELKTTENTSAKDHRVRLHDLTPGTRYFYQIRQAQKPVYAGAEFWFVTSPPVGGKASTRIWVTGDQGYASEVQSAVRDAMITWTGLNARDNKPNIDLWLTTGDNAYKSGSVAQFRKNFFTPFEPILRNIPVWPAYGNHDARRWSFYRLFDFPVHGEAGGVASGTESYYSFDYANVHVLMLDSHASDMSPNSPMLSWLKKDLANTKQSWLIAVMHHPPYTRGTHNSDNKLDSAGRMVMVRENIVPLLEQHGVDMVISGHSHGYERSWFMLCNYKDSTQFNRRYIQDRGDNEQQVKMIYRKKSLQREALSGTIYMVMGSSAKMDEAQYNHPVMPLSLKQTGSVVLDIEDNKLTSNFLTSDFTVNDRFQIIKGDATAPAAKSSCDFRVKHPRSYYY